MEAALAIFVYVYWERATRRLVGLACAIADPGVVSAEAGPGVEEGLVDGPGGPGVRPLQGRTETKGGVGSR